MTRTPLPRYIADIRLAVEISALDELAAEERLEAVQAFINERLGRSTFQRIAGKPTLVYRDIISDVVSA